MSIETTLVLLKPGVLQRRIAGEIIARFERRGLDVVGIKMLCISKDQARSQYVEHEGKTFFSELLDYTSSSPAIALALRGEEAVRVVRSMIGSTKPADAAPGTIRGDYALHTALNVVHASDSPGAATRELELYFAPEEIHDWKDGNDVWK